MATPEETKETMQTETTSDNEVKETVEETTNETAVENDEATFDTIKKELEAQKELLQQSEDHYKRLQADFANFRRRNEKEREELSSVVLQGLIKDLLPIIDNFERALAVEGAAGDAAPHRHRYGGRYVRQEAPGRRRRVPRRPLRRVQLSLQDHQAQPHDPAHPDGGMSRARRRAAQHMTGRQKSR